MAEIDEQVGELSNLNGENAGGGSGGGGSSPKRKSEVIILWLFIA